MKNYINSDCICKLCLIEKYNLLTIFPCNHIIHKECFDKLKNKKYCPFCLKDIKKVVNEKQLLKMARKNNKYRQNYIDMLCNKRYDHLTKINYPNLFLRLPDFLLELATFFSYKTKNDVRLSAERILNLCNIKINEINKPHIPNRKQIFIGNHSSYLDTFIFFTKLNCGAIGSTVEMGRFINLAKVANILLINRGLTKNTTQKIRNHVKKYNRMYAFPEGRMSNPKCLGDFRTGVFYSGYPIQPIIIKYDKCIYSDNLKIFFYKLLSQDEVNVTLEYLEPFYPPFDKDKIEYVRKKMAEKGNLYLSNVSNRDHKDKKYNIE